MQQLLKNKANRNCFLKWYRTAYRMRTRRIECKKDSSADLPLSALWHDRNFRYNLREAFFFLEECFKFLKIFLIRNLHFDEVGNYSNHSASESRAVEVMRNNDAFFLSLSSWPVFRTTRTKISDVLGENWTVWNEEDKTMSIK